MLKLRTITRRCVDPGCVQRDFRWIKYETNLPPVLFTFGNEDPLELWRQPS